MDAPFTSANATVPSPDAVDNLRAAGYVPLPPFAIIDEHTHVRSDGRGVEVFDRPRLERLAAKLNYKAHRLNSPLPAGVGHTRPGSPEVNQPGIAGYCTNYQVGPGFELDPQTGMPKYAIWATPWSPPGGVETFKRFPHRSIELWTGGEEGDDIHPLALLGTTAPRRNLGVHMFSRDGGSVAANGQYHYAREVSSMPDYGPSLPGGLPPLPPQQPATGATRDMRVGDMSIDQLGNSLVPIIASSKAFAPLFQMQDELAGLLGGDESMDPTGQPGGMGGMPGMGQPGMGGMPGAPGATPEMMGMNQFGVPGPTQRPAQYDRGQAAYDPFNLFGQQPAPQVPPPVPQQFNRPGVQPVYQPPPGAPFQQVPLPQTNPGDPYFAHFQRLEQLVLASVQQTQAVIQQLVPTVTQYQKDKEASGIDAALAHLAGVERIRFDPAAEKKHLETLTEPQRVEHYQRMRANYGRVEALPGQQFQTQVPTPMGFPVPGAAQVPGVQPHPLQGHALTVGAMMPGQANLTHFARPGSIPSEPANDEAAMPGMDPFLVAAAARQAKVDVPTYLHMLRTGGGANGKVEPVR